MNINFTVVVQAVHFLIAYAILERLLFKPSIKVLEQEKKDKETIQNHIYTEQKKLNQKRIAKEKNWQKFRKQFAFYTPKIKEIAIKREAQELPPLSEISEKQVDQYAHSLEKIITKEVEHV